MIRWLLIALVFLASLSADAQLLQTNVGPGSAGAGGCTGGNGTTTITATGASTFTVPAGCTSLQIEAFGGGAAGSGQLGGSGGGYSGDTASNHITVTPGQTIFYSVGAAGAVSWVNPNANSQPVGAPGVVAAAGSGQNTPGGGTIGLTNFTGGVGGNDAFSNGGAGGGGAGSAANGGAGMSGATFGPGGTPDGGNGGPGGNGATAGTVGSQPGGGGGGSDSGSAAAGAAGQVRITWGSGPNCILLYTLNCILYSAGSSNQILYQ